MEENTYIVVTGETRELLQQSVNFKIPEYQPLGGVAIAVGADYQIMFFQAMIKNEEYNKV